jgi:hypothetical protein
LFVQLTVKNQKMGKLSPDRRDFKFQFNKRERPQDRSANLFMFRGSEKGIKGDPLFFGSPEGEIKSEEESCK